ncbi:MAG: hypothetical protein ACOCRN_02340 [Spirochaetia bacterium]
MSAEKEKPKKKPRIPRLFPVSMPEKRFRRRILKRIPLRSEREWLETLYSSNTGVAEHTEAGERGGATEVARDERLTVADIKRLRALAKAVKHNRGFLQPVKLGLLGIVVGTLLVFALVFATPLASNAIERGLEEVFAARAELDGLSLRPLEPGVAFERLAVANRAQPMENLFEAGYGELRLDLGQLIRGRVVIRNMEVNDIAFGTEREESGELPPGRRPGPAAEPGAPGPDEQLSSLLSDVSGEVEGVASGIDAREIVEAEMNALSTPDVFTNEVERMQSVAGEWETRAEEAGQAVETLEQDVQTLAAIDPSGIDSLSRLRDNLETAERVTEESRDLYRLGEAGLEEAGAVRGQVDGAVSRVRDTIDEDIAYIRSRIPDPDTVLRAPFAGPVAAIVREYAQPYVEKATVVMDAYERLQAIQARFASDEAGVDPTPRRGRDLVFPSREYPRFLLERASVSVLEGPLVYEGSLTGVSSAPELIGEPSRASFNWADEDERGGAVNARVDLRGSADTRVSLDTDLNAQHASLTVPTSGVISVDTIDGDYDLDSSIQVSPRGEVRVEAGISLLQPDVGFSASNELTRRTQSVLERTGTVEVLLRLPGEGRPPVSTNLDDALVAEIQEFLQELKTRAESEAESMLRARFDGELEDLTEYAATAEQTVARARERYGEVVALYEQAQREREQIEQRIANLQSELEQRARDEADSAAQDAEDRARREVEDRARDALDDFPGF